MRPGRSCPTTCQLQVKQQQVDEALRRLGRLDGFELEPIVPAVEQWRYRNKLEYSYGTAPDGQLICGFHAAGSWEQIDHIEDCLLASERGNELRRLALDALRAQNLGAYDRRNQIGFLRNLVVREGRRTGQEQVRLVTSPGDFDAEAFAAALGPVQSLIWTQAGGVAETTQGGQDELITGTPRIEEELGGLRFALSSEAFFQTNTEMAEQLYGVAAEYAALKGFERVYDLCCGIGTIGLTLASRAAEVVGVEIVPEAVEDAAFNARMNEITNARFIAGDVRVVLKGLIEDGARPGRHRRGPAARRACRRRSSPGSPSRTRSGSSTSPATRRRSRRTRRSSSRPGTSSSASARSTSSRRRRTSSAWRCSKERHRHRGSDVAGTKWVPARTLDHVASRARVIDPIGLRR